MRRSILLLALVACNVPEEAPEAQADAIGAEDPSLAVDGDSGAAEEQVAAEPDAPSIRDGETVGGVSVVRVGQMTYAADRILIGTYGAPPKAFVLGGFTLRRIADFGLIDGGVYALPDGLSAPDAVQLVSAAGVAAYAELDQVRHASAVNDPLRSYQWSLDKVGADAAWLKSTGVGAIVAVIDTGVAVSTVDGITSLLAGWDYVNNDANPTDDNGHGTHVANTIGEKTNNGVGCAGLAYGASILPIKALDAAGSGFTSNVILGVDYAVQHGADVINMSLGASTSSTSEASAMLAAYNAGVFVVAASGNATANSVDYPAAYPGVVSVGATGFSNTRAPYSNIGAGLDLVAPGGDTSVDANGDGYGDGILQETRASGVWNYYFYQGTSMATPHVAAAAALIMAKGATNLEAESTLKSTALDLGAAGVDTTYGSGLIQADKALTAYLSATTVNKAPVASTGGPYTGTAGTARTLSGAGSTDSDGTITSWAWSFGDGTTGTGASVSHAWTTAGTYTVSLTVTDNAGAKTTASTTATIAAASTCDFSGTVSSGSVYHALGTLPKATLVDRWLRFTTTTANLDLYLESAAVGSTRWSTVARSTSTTAGAAEHVAYTTTTKQNGYQFRWRVARASGSSSYCISR
jgi:serine protease